MKVNLVFIVIFEMTETLFDYGMLNLRNDGMAIFNDSWDSMGLNDGVKIIWW